jgi:hypothetical protein
MPRVAQHDERGCVPHEDSLYTSAQGQEKMSDNPGRQNTIGPMSGIVGHTLYALLGLRAAEARNLPIAVLLRRHQASYLAGAYLGCDIQAMPEAVCVETGEEVGFGTVPVEKSPYTGGPVRPFRLPVRGAEFTARQIHELFYGRSHLVLGWREQERRLAVPWDRLPAYFAAVVCDGLDSYGPGERPLAYAFGWMAHVVSDALIKGAQPGLSLHLLDGQYTPRNRPIQDLVSFHEVGRKELGLNWAALLTDLAETPVEPIQSHYMRVGIPNGALGREFGDGWAPERAWLLEAVLVENRRFLRHYVPAVLADMELHETSAGPDCNETLRQTVGLSYPEMVELAQKADFRHTLWQIGAAVADMFASVTQREPRLADVRAQRGPSWEGLTRRWRKTAR